jgi:hypothetical protein
MFFYKPHFKMIRAQIKALSGDVIVENASMDQIDIPAQKSPEIKAKRASVPTIILWVTSLFCALPLATGDTSVQSILLFLIALVLFPPLTAFLERKLAKPIGMWPRTAAVIFLLIVAGTFVEKEQAAKKATEPTKVSEPATTFESELARTESLKTADTNPQAEGAGSTTTETKETDKADQVESRSFSFGIDEYVSWVNKNLAKTTSKLPALRIKKREKQAEQIFYYAEINKHLGFMVFENMDKKVLSVTFLGQGDGTMTSGANVVLAAIAGVRALHQTAEIDSHLGKLAMELVNKEGKTIVDDGIKYDSTFNTTIGLMISMTPVEE